jgi:hypothetical protein
VRHDQLSNALYFSILIYNLMSTQTQRSSTDLMHLIQSIIVFSIYDSHNQDFMDWIGVFSSEVCQTLIKKIKGGEMINNTNVSVPLVCTGT